MLACVGRDFQKRCPNAGSWTLTSIADSMADVIADLSIRGSSRYNHCVNLTSNCCVKVEGSPCLHSQEQTAAMASAASIARSCRKVIAKERNSVLGRSKADAPLTPDYVHWQKLCVRRLDRVCEGFGTRAYRTDHDSTAITSKSSIMLDRNSRSSSSNLQAPSCYQRRAQSYSREA